ncbi:class I SAM-dependent methyltransferase [Ahniella affigens]|nr:class I SAM-dependent methyltransferase [Ahniella affigens]
MTQSPEEAARLHVPAGHFYSPIIDLQDLMARRDQVWPQNPVDPPGVDFNGASHIDLLTNVFPTFMPDYQYPEVLDESADLTQFFTRNSQFSWLDARALFVLLRHWRPRRVIEVGSGFSTLLMADVNRRFLDGASEITAIEPYPRDFLSTERLGLKDVVVKKVQDVPLAFFDQLQAGDLLFIDSSHVSKTGSDVNHLFLEVLPRLKSGVRIHVHDVFYPNDYLQDWVLGEGRSWNEQYMLQCFLAFNSAFRVIFGCNYAFTRHFELVRSALAHPNGAAFSGGSFYLERV